MRDEGGTGMSSDRGAFLAWMAAVALGVLLVAGGLALARRDHRADDARRESEQLSALRREGYLVVERVGTLASVPDPLDAAWDAAAPRTVAVRPQAVTMPVLEDTSVTSVELQALTDGERIAWRIRWADPEPDENVDAGRFCDAAALQFPLVPDASFMMGGPGMRVQILHWKALWQKDHDVHFQDVQDVHPNYWTDLYWFATGAFPYPIHESFRDPRSHAWLVAYRSGNPMADFLRAQPVEELLAEGFGTLTHQPESAAAARGVWRDGRWQVTFVRPLATQDPSDAQLYRGGRGQLAVAVWQGSAGNVGGRKHYSEWLPFVVHS